jgi:hypothetical protein
MSAKVRRSGERSSLGYLGTSVETCAAISIKATSMGSVDASMRHQLAVHARILSACAQAPLRPLYARAYFVYVRLSDNEDELAMLMA